MTVMTTADKIADLERRVVQLEQAGRRYGPIEAKPATEPLPSWPAWPAIPTIGEQRCPTCGILLSPVMGYVCGKANCPTGLGGVYCTTTSGPV
jgi:hypothetical protein